MIYNRQLANFYVVIFSHPRTTHQPIYVWIEKLTLCRQCKNLVMMVELSLYSFQFCNNKENPRVTDYEIICHGDRIY